MSNSLEQHEDFRTLLHGSVWRKKIEQIRTPIYIAVSSNPWNLLLISGGMVDECVKFINNISRSTIGAEVSVLNLRMLCRIADAHPLSARRLLDLYYQRLNEVGDSIDQWETYRLAIGMVRLKNRSLAFPIDEGYALEAISSKAWMLNFVDDWFDRHYPVPASRLHRTEIPNRSEGYPGILRTTVLEKKPLDYGPCSIRTDPDSIDLP